MRHRAGTALAFALALTAPAAAQEDTPAPPPQIQVDEGEMAVGELIKRWALATDRLPVTDPQIEAIRIRFAEAGGIDVPTLLRLLDFHDVVVTETGPLINAHHRRNLAQKEGPPWDVVEDAAELAALNRVVTHVIPVRHGSGNAIFATVRGLLTRDTNRIGNILYVQGPEVIILVDLADKVAYYAEVIEQLDRAPESRHVDVSILELPRTHWRAYSKAKKSGEALLAALGDSVDAGQATVLEEASLSSLSGQFSMSRRVRLSAKDQMVIQLQCRTATRTSQGPKGSILVSSASGLELSLEVELEQEGSSLSRSLVVPVPRPSEGDVRVVAMAGREGTVVVLGIRCR